MTNLSERIERSLSAQIRVELTDREMTQQDLADKVGITAGSLSRYMQGHKSMPMPTFLAVADALGMDPAALMAAAVERSKR